MNAFERAAIFTMIEGIEAQMRGLKSLLAVAANQGTEHKTTSTINANSDVLDEREDEQLAKQLEAARQAQIKKMGVEAHNVFLSELQTVAGGMPDDDSASGQAMSEFNG